MKDVKNKGLIAAVLASYLFDVLMYNWHIVFNDNTDLAWRIYDLGQSFTFLAYIAVIYAFVHRFIEIKWVRSVSFGWVIFAFADVVDELFFRNVATDMWEYWTLLAFIFGVFIHATGRQT